MESIGVREINIISEKEGQDKGICGLSQLQREESNDQNIMEALPAEQKSWEKGYGPTLEAYRNLWTKEADPKGGGGRKRKKGG